MTEVPLKDSILFIVNPISGNRKRRNMEMIIRKTLDPALGGPVIVFTGYQGHATEISRDAAARGAAMVVAVGGDGTVNETAAGLTGTSTVMGIIPSGSGNGLARHLKIPMNPRKAIALLSKGRVVSIDTATINDQLFVNVAGVGFDATIAKRFSMAGKRGFSTYFRITAASYRDYKPRQYRLEIDGKVYKRTALLVSFANSSQFGNNTSIDPSASVSDGLIDVCIVGKIPFWKTLFLAPLLFINRFDRTRYVEIIRGKNVILHRKKGKNIHLDGDPQEMGKVLHLKINPLSLKVIIPV